MHFPRYLFVGGLHRSGTSLLTRLIASHGSVASIQNAPVPENEGCYLQGAIPHTAQHGRPMHFATDPDHHLIEGHRLDRLETRLRLEHDWDRWFDPDRPWRLETSPVNLTRTRLYQQLLPLSQFVLIVRHPEAVAAAVAKWVDRPFHDLVDHWLDAHAQFERDLPYLHAVMTIRYEDLVTAPASVMGGVFAFMSLPQHQIADDLQDGNRDYPISNRMTSVQADRAERWGYLPGMKVTAVAPRFAHPLRSVRDSVQAAWHDGSCK